MQQTNRSSLHLRRFYLCMGSIWLALRTAQGFQLVKVHNGHHAPRRRSPPEEARCSVQRALNLLQELDARRCLWYPKPRL